MTARFGRNQRRAAREAIAAAETRASVAEREAIARAILAERNGVAQKALKCAAIYEDHAGAHNAGAATALRQFAADIAASAIRSSHE